MANVIINDTHLTNIADAIREKTGTSDTYKPGEMATAIAAIEAGGGGDLPEEALYITGDCSDMFHNGKWDWFIENYGDKITTEKITNCNSMFYNSEVKEIPFEINIDDTTITSITLSYMFSKCNKLTQAPTINGYIEYSPSSNTYVMKFDNCFSYCYDLREIPEDYFVKLASKEYWGSKKVNASGRGSSTVFASCYSLRNQIDLEPLKNCSTSTSSSSVMYQSLFKDCRCLDEITSLPVETVPVYTSNQFSNTFSYCYRLKNVIFKTQEDGTPYTVRWKNQILSFEHNVGQSGVPANITSTNSGITADKEVIDDATYQALKNDPDWFTCNIKYSRYNHDSAVATINSLPDTSAYLAANGGTNTIKFNSRCGELTDGGGVSTLTEEEIAVATAKGWTVSLI